MLGWKMHSARPHTHMRTLHVCDRIHLFSRECVRGVNTKTALHRHLFSFSIRSLFWCLLLISLWCPLVNCTSISLIEHSRGLTPITASASPNQFTGFKVQLPEDTSFFFFEHLCNDRLAEPSRI